MAIKHYLITFARAVKCVRELRTERIGGGGVVEFIMFTKCDAVTVGARDDINVMDTNGHPKVFITAPAPSPFLGFQYVSFCIIKFGFGRRTNKSF